MCRTCLFQHKNRYFLFISHWWHFSLSIFPHSFLLCRLCPFSLYFSHTSGSLLSRLSHLSHPSSSHLAFFFSFSSLQLTATPSHALPSCLCPHIFSHFQMSETESPAEQACICFMCVDFERSATIEIVKTFVPHYSQISWPAAANMGSYWGNFWAENIVFFSLCWP